MNMLVGKDVGLGKSIAVGGMNICVGNAGITVGKSTAVGSEGVETTSARAGVRLGMLAATSGIRVISTPGTRSRGLPKLQDESNASMKITKTQNTWRRGVPIPAIKVLVID